MALTEDQKQIVAEITKYRKMCLVHRYLYYVKDESIISDAAYDTMEKRLRYLVTSEPELAFKADYSMDCPSTTVGSSLADAYPRRIEQLAESLLEQHKKETTPLKTSSAS